MDEAFRLCAAERRCCCELSSCDPSLLLEGKEVWEGRRLPLVTLADVPLEELVLGRTGSTWAILSGLFSAGVLERHVEYSERYGAMYAPHEFRSRSFI